MMKKLLIAATLAAAAVAATPLLAQQTTDKKPQQTAATDDCPMAGEHGNRGERRAEMQKRMREMHARMGAREGQGRNEEASTPPALSSPEKRRMSARAAFFVLLSRSRNGESGWRPGVDAASVRLEMAPATQRNDHPEGFDYAERPCSWRKP